MKKTPVAILTDVTRCIGCEKCVAACKREHDLGADHPWPGQRSVDDLSASRFTTIVRRPGGHFVRRQCRHCLEPACASACIVGALHKRPDGPVVYDADKCMGCRYCMVACPYDVPRYEWDSSAPRIRKCTFCVERLGRGLQPACTAACPTGATVFGSRDEMLAEARRRLRASPKKYLQKIYGERELGGTSILYLSNVPLGFLGWSPKRGERPLPELTWAAMKKVPWVVLGMGGLMTGLYWLIGRRMKLAARATLAEAPATEEAEPGEQANAGEAATAAQESKEKKQ